MTREQDALVAEKVFGRKAKTKAVVSNDGGRSACAWVDPCGTWCTAESLIAWLNERQAQGTKLDCKIEYWCDEPYWTSNAGSDYHVLKHVRENWERIQLMDFTWHLLKLCSEDMLNYKPGFYSLAALEVLGV